MKSLYQSFTAAALLGTALSAQAQEETVRYTNMQPSFMYQDSAMSAQHYVLHEAELNKGRYVSERARLDQAIGILCESRTISNLQKAENGQIIAAAIEEQDAHCVDAKLLPDSWNASKTAKRTSPAGHVEAGYFQSRKTPNMIYEWFKRTDQQTGILNTTVRSWDMSRNEVCLETSDAHLIGLTTYKTYASQKWGCFPVKNETYAESLRAKVGMTGPF